MKISQAFPSKYLKHTDLGEDERAVLTMVEVVLENVGTEDDSEEKPILYFKETKKGLVLNKTNATTIAALYGDDTDEWEGKKIILCVEETDFAGKRVECIRVQKKAPKKQTKKRSESEDDSDEEEEPRKKKTRKSSSDEEDDDDLPFD